MILQQETFYPCFRSDLFKKENFGLSLAIGFYLLLSRYLKKYLSFLFASVPWSALICLRPLEGFLFIFPQKSFTKAQALKDRLEQTTVRLDPLRFPSRRTWPDRTSAEVASPWLVAPKRRARNKPGVAWSVRWDRAAGGPPRSDPR